MNSSTTTTAAIDELKAAHRATWDSGDYAAVARDLVTEVAEAAVEAAQPAAGDDILDVATGSGNAAIPAARRGANVTGLDLAPTLLEVARERAASENLDIDWIEGDAEALPFADASFDTVVSTLVLCGVDDQPRVVRELRRVLRPGGRLIFMVHVRSDDPRVAKMQDRMNSVNRFLVCCDCNRPTLDTIRSTGFEVTELEQTELPKAPPFGRPLIVGTATAPVA